MSVHAGEYIVKGYLSIVYGPCGWAEATATADSYNERWQTDEYRVEEWKP